MRVNLSKADLEQISSARDLSMEGQCLGCAVCFAQQVKPNSQSHFDWCWVGKALKVFVR